LHTSHRDVRQPHEFAPLASTSASEHRLELGPTRLTS